MARVRVHGRRRMRNAGLEGERSGQRRHLLLAPKLSPLRNLWRGGWAGRLRRSGGGAGRMTSMQSGTATGVVDAFQSHGKREHFDGGRASWGLSPSGLPPLRGAQPLYVVHRGLAEEAL